MSDADKHRALHVVASVIDVVDVGSVLPDGTTIGILKSMTLRISGGRRRVSHLLPLDSDAPIGSLMPYEALPQLVDQPGQVKVDADLTLVVTLDPTTGAEGDVRPIVAVLRELHDFIRDEVLPPLIALP